MISLLLVKHREVVVASAGLLADTLRQQFVAERRQRAPIVVYRRTPFVLCIGCQLQRTDLMVQLRVVVCSH